MVLAGTGVGQGGAIERGRTGMPRATHRPRKRLWRLGRQLQPNAVDRPGEFSAMPGIQRCRRYIGEDVAAVQVVL